MVDGTQGVLGGGSHQDLLLQVRARRAPGRRLSAWVAVSLDGGNRPNRACPDETPLRNSFPGGSTYHQATDCLPQQGEVAEPVCRPAADQPSASGLTTVSTKSPIAPSVAPICSICGKCPASAIGAKWPFGNARGVVAAVAERRDAVLLAPDDQHRHGDAVQAAAQLRVVGELLAARRPRGSAGWRPRPRAARR